MGGRFPWETLRAIVGGTSALDVPHLHCDSTDSAEAFLECYGFDWNVPAQREEIELLRRESIAFIEEELLDDGEEIMGEVRGETDARTLLIWASSAERSPRQRWTCAAAAA